MEKFHLKNAETKIVGFYSPSLIYFLPPWKSLLSKMFFPKTVGGLSSGEGAALRRSSGCLDASSLALVAAEVAAPVLGTRASFILGPHHPGVPAGEMAAWAAVERIRAVSWDGMLEVAAGESQERQGTFLGAGGEHKRLKPALSACYRAAISRAGVWQSVNTSSKTTWRMNLGPT